MSNKITAGSLYDMNKQLFKKIKAPSEESINIELAHIGAGFSSNLNAKYYMLLCKERSDYTLFHLKNFNYNKAIQELKEVLEERGEIMGFDFIHGENAYQCWVREREGDRSVFMFMLFDADGMIVDI